MLISIRCLLKCWPCLLLCLFLGLLQTNAANAGGGPQNVAVVRNLNSPLSVQIADYYVTQRHIPPENVCDIRTSTAEIVTQAECIQQIVEPIRTFLKNPAIADRIDYIVITKGIPLAADYGYSSGQLSVTSILTCVGDPTVTQPIRNGYGPTGLYAPQTAFSHKLSLENRHLYLVTRLDAYTKDEIFKMIDRSTAKYSGGPFMLDSQAQVNVSPSYGLLNGRIQNANKILRTKALPILYDEGPAFLGDATNLMGYFSWGSNDPAYSAATYKSNTFLPGSIADTFVSTSGRTFNPTTGGQSLMADLITCGACGLNGFVSEPYTAYTTYPDVLFDRYTKGYNMAESFYAATPELFWKSVVIGDPLMAPFSTPPIVSVEIPSGSLTGPTALITAKATDASGIAKVEYYFDGKYVATSTTAPYSVILDFTSYATGTHKVEVIAYENTPVATQGYASATITLNSPVSLLSKIADSFRCADGQEVKTAPMVVSAGEADLGGGEFYIQDPTRVGGIRVISEQEVEEGDWVVVTGKMTTQSGERSIAASTVEIGQHQNQPVRPLFMSNKTVGGGDFCRRTTGITNCRGLRNVGLLIKTLGRVTYTGNSNEPYFYIDDGSSLRDGSGHIGLRVLCRTFSKPLPGSYVSVTGLSSCSFVDNIVVRAIKLRTPRDISPIFTPKPQ